MNKDKILQDILVFLKSSRLMTLASSLNDETWACTVYYGIDELGNFYLVTDPNTKHSQMIQVNPRVAFAIFDSHTKVTDVKKGIQGQGICRQVLDMEEVSKGLSLWHSANPGVEGRINLEAVQKAEGSRVYKIEPTFLKFFNKELYGELESGIWKREG